MQTCAATGAGAAAGVTGAGVATGEGTQNYNHRPYVHAGFAGAGAATGEGTQHVSVNPKLITGNMSLAGASAAADAAAGVTGAGSRKKGFYEVVILEAINNYLQGGY